jgi:molecular chaperone IbpA
MRNYDFAPLTRSTVGFDRVFDLLDSAFTASQTDEGYPPYNIVKTGDTSYRIELAVAGFGPDDLSIVAQENVLTVSGSRNASQQQLYLHHGIASRAFERRFNLADYVKVAKADLVNGLLTIDLVREIPEAMRPRQIQIGGTAQQPEQIEQKDRLRRAFARAALLPAPRGSMKMEGLCFAASSWGQMATSSEQRRLKHPRSTRPLRKFEGCCGPEKSGRRRGLSYGVAPK